LEDYWTIIDVNDDYAWYYSDNYDADNAGGGSVTVMCPSIFGLDYDADDYLVSNPLIITEAGDYNITFDVRSYDIESFRILYGTSPNPEEMEVLADYPDMAAMYPWESLGENFEITTPGDYYFAFHYYSPNYTGYSMYLDNISIDQGLFNGVPDITIYDIGTLASSCSLSSNTPITVRVINQGNKPIDEFTLTYQVNGNTVASQTFEESLSVGGIKTVEFTQTADFSAIGDYEIVVTASTPEEENTDNNEFRISVTHYTPVAALPFETDFSDPDDFIKNWSPSRYNGWGRNESWGCYYPNAAIPLLSRCITLPVGDYRFSYIFAAGVVGFGARYVDDFYVAYGRSGTDPMTWEPANVHLEMCTYGEKLTDDIELHITEAGEYQIAIVPTYVGMPGGLSIFNTSLFETPEHDIRINRIESPGSLARQTPKYQVDGNKTFNAVIENRGLSAENGAIELQVNDKAASVDFNFAAVREIKTIPVTMDMTLPTGTYDLQFAATIGSSDASPDDNLVEITKIVSDSTYVWDSIDYFIGGVGADAERVGLGLIYELEKEDVLTSINLGFYDYGYADNIGIAVYPVSDDLVLGLPLFTPQIYKRITGSSITFDVPDTELEPGKYYFEVQQVDGININIAYDLDRRGYFCLNEHLGQFGAKLEYLSGEEYQYGYIHIRPNFGKNAPTGLVGVKDSNPQVKLHPNPVSDVLSVDVLNQQIKQISVYNASGAVVYQNSKINKSEYKLNVSDLASGFYFITVQTNTGVSTSKFVVK
jgi:hypothetical protein